MIDPPDTPLTPSQQIRHSRRFDIDEAYDKLHADLAAANARIAELEASVKRISSTRFRELDQSRERIVALEAERDGNSHYQLIVAAMSILEDIDCVPENPGILEGIESMRDRIVFLEDAARQVTPIAPESLIEQSKLIAAEAKIKELEETIWNYSDDCAFMDRAREKIAALEAEREAPDPNGCRNAVALWLEGGKYRSLIHRHDGTFTAAGESEGKYMRADTIPCLADALLNWPQDADDLTPCEYDLAASRAREQRLRIAAKRVVDLWPEVSGTTMGSALYDLSAALAAGAPAPQAEYGPRPSGPRCPHCGSYDQAWQEPIGANCPFCGRPRAIQNVGETPPHLKNIGTRPEGVPSAATRTPDLP